MSSTVTFQRIRSFIAVAELGGFRAAAEHLSISQPALTSHIKALEEHLGVRLLRRTTRRASLTPEGMLFLDKAQLAMGQLASAVDDLRQRAAVRRGRIVMGCTPSIAYSIAPRVLAEFRSSHPDVQVILIDDHAEAIEARLLASELDFIIGPAPARARELDYVHMCDDPFMAVFPAGHPLEGRGSVPVEELLGYDLVAIRAGMRMRSILQLALDREGYELKPVQEVYSQYTLCALVQAGLGVGLLPRLIVSGLASTGLKAALVSAPQITRRIGVTKRRDQPLHVAGEKLIELVRREVQASSDTPRKNRPAAPSRTKVST